MSAWTRVIHPSCARNHDSLHHPPRVAPRQANRRQPISARHVACHIHSAPEAAARQRPQRANRALPRVPRLPALSALPAPAHATMPREPSARIQFRAPESALKIQKPLFRFIFHTKSISHVCFARKRLQHTKMGVYKPLTMLLSSTKIRVITETLRG